MKKTSRAAGYVGVEIGGTKLQVCFCDAGHRIVDVRRLIVDKQGGAEGIRRDLAGAIRAVVADHKPAAIGVGYGGPVDWRTGRIARSFHVEGWNDFPLGDWMRDLSGRPSFVENDANAAAFAEATLGAGRGRSPVLYTNSGSGVGAGLVVDGRLYHGCPPGEVEVGHLRTGSRGGILEDQCSGWSLDRRIRRIVRLQPRSRLAKLVGASRGCEARHLAPAIAAGDRTARKLVEDAARAYALGLSHAVHLLHPEVIVLGGGVALMGELWREAVARHLEPLLMSVFRPGPVVVLAALGEGVVPLGAAALARERLRSGT